MNLHFILVRSFQADIRIVILQMKKLRFKKIGFSKDVSSDWV